MRWQLAEADGGQGALFEEVLGWHAGKGEYRNLEFLHVRAQRIINTVPVESRMPFTYTINPYRGCSHACVYCLAGDTPVLTADGRTKPIADLRAGDLVYGTVRFGNYRRYVVTPVLDHWSTVKAAYRITLRDGTRIVASDDHRFLSDRGWKHVTGAESGRLRRPHLTTGNSLLGTGQFADRPKATPEYRRGFLCGMIRGDGLLRSYEYRRLGRAHGTVHRFRLALVDLDGLHRAQDYLAEFGIRTRESLFQRATANTQAVTAISAQSQASVEAIREIVAWPTEPSASWTAGFLAGIFDAEGSYAGGILRIANKDPVLIERICAALCNFGFDIAIEVPKDPDRCTYLRIRGGLREHLRFFHVTDPAIVRKRTIEGQALKNKAALGVVSIEALGLDIPMYDITTGTGDFIANGVVSHNCFARPTHAYLDLGAGEDFERKIVVKVNAVERLRAELHPRRWKGDPIALGTNTDPYQRCEGKYRLTRGIIETLGEFKNPFSILTKGTLILRDLDVLQEAAAHTSVRANFSIGTLDEKAWRGSEPGTPHPMRRVEAVARLNAAGIPTGVLVAPVLPGISDDPAQIDAVVKACVDAGAVSISGILLHLRKGVREVFEPWLGDHHPELRERYAALYPKAYAAKAQQDQLTARIRAGVARHGGTAGSPLHMRDSPGDQPSRPARIEWPSRRRTPAKAPEQLALLPDGGGNSRGDNGVPGPPRV